MCNAFLNNTDTFQKLNVVLIAAVLGIFSCRFAIAQTPPPPPMSTSYGLYHGWQNFEAWNARISLNNSTNNCGGYGGFNALQQRYP